MVICASVHCFRGKINPYQLAHWHLFLWWLGRYYAWISSKAIWWTTDSNLFVFIVSGFGNGQSRFLIIVKIAFLDLWYCTFSLKYRYAKWFILLLLIQIYFLGGSLLRCHIYQAITEPGFVQFGYYSVDGVCYFQYWWRLVCCHVDRCSSNGPYDFGIFAAFCTE